MKKIMIMLGIAATAAIVQAASVDWKVNYSGQGATWAGNGASVMAFSGADYDAIIKLVTDTGSEALSSDLASYSLGSATFSNNRGAAYTSSSTSDAPNSMFFMIFADGSYDAGSAVTWTSVTDVTGNLYEPPASGTELSLNATSFANSGTIAKFSSGEGEGGGTTDVPEPTSGLLLVLGAAALALKRKCA